LALQYRQRGKKVLLGAADTFRAAANEQLEIWAERSAVEILRQAQGADPASVAFDAVSAAIARGIDVVIIDTAGRLHTKSNLMEELAKIRRVIGKKMAGAPHEVLLVIDATTGQNGLQQARLFSEAAGVTGIVLTKLDGTARGGIVLAIRDELKIPVAYVGVGEKVEDLAPFDAEAFAGALFESEESQS
jgi:fused signal recognition particle receptor